MSQERKVDTAWRRLTDLTPARIGLGRSGTGLPTTRVLEFAMAHAQARDAVHARFDAEALAGEITALGYEVLRVASTADSTELFLRRPDLGRRLSDADRAKLSARDAQACDLAIVIGDGLSATAVHGHALNLLKVLLPALEQRCLKLAPLTIASGTRVALGDEVGALLKAKLVLVLIGERPGLSAPDSLGAYLTFAPKPGRNDAERNCVSNIRSAGLSYDLAAFRLDWLINAALQRQLTGVQLKDQSETVLIGKESGPPSLSTS